MKVSKHYPIGQVCKIADLPHSTIRFWEKTFSGLRPLRSSGGHRYYSAEQVELVHFIKKLLYEDGLTIEGAKKHMANANGSLQASPTEADALIDKQPTKAAELGEDMKLRIKAELEAILAILNKVNL
ncbi:MAG: MerR family transcriptional regulator [Deferribacteraceae bacterium]|jgi:DNA-binding transcriptional MerR regulator|nr:MerR family transcriptional regulator [Deferribacteraceae bacterium]